MQFNCIYTWLRPMIFQFYCWESWGLVEELCQGYPGRLQSLKRSQRVSILSIPTRHVQYYPICSMVLEYLPTFALTNLPNVGKYTIHGAYGNAKQTTNKSDMKTYSSCLTCSSQKISVNWPASSQTTTENLGLSDIREQNWRDYNLSRRRFKCWASDGVPEALGFNGFYQTWREAGKHMENASGMNHPWPAPGDPRRSFEQWGAFLDQISSQICNQISAPVSHVCSQQFWQKSEYQARTNIPCYLLNNYTWRSLESLEGLPIKSLAPYQATKPLSSWACQPNGTASRLGVMGLHHSAATEHRMLQDCHLRYLFLPLSHKVGHPHFQPNPNIRFTEWLCIHYITSHYVTLHCIALHCITLHCIASHYITLHYIHTCIIYLKIYTNYKYIYICNLYIYINYIYIYKLYIQIIYIYT